MNGEYLKEFINTIAFLMPVLLLVWKSAKLTSRLEVLEQSVKEKTEKFCKDHSEMREDIEREQKSRRNDTQMLLSALNDIQKCIVRIETKIDIEEKKK